MNFISLSHSLSISEANPVSLIKSISIEGSNVSGVITQSGLLDIIDNEQIPSFSVSYCTL